MCPHPACEGKPSLTFLQSLAKKVHTRKTRPPAVTECNVIDGGVRLDRDFKQWMQDAHNLKRIKVASGEESPQPSASNMNALVIIIKVIFHFLLRTLFVNKILSVGMMTCQVMPLGGLTLVHLVTVPNPGPMVRTSTQ